MKLTLILSLALLLSASAQAGVLPNDAVLDGKTIGDWSAEWWKWLLPIPSNQSPALDIDGSHANVGQPDGPIFFLAKGYSFSRRGARSFAVPEGKYLFVPLLGSYNDNIDTVPPLTVAQLRDLTAAGVDLVNELHCIIDGIAVPDLFSHRAISPVFSINFTNGDNLLAVGLGRPFTGLDDPMVADGYYLIVEPLALGTHVMSFGGTIGPPVNAFLDFTDTITIGPTNHPPVADASATPARVISPNNQNARVILDGSRSSDPDNDPLTYSWLDGGAVIGDSLLATNTLAVGSHHISLVVSDGRLSATNTITMEVLTPCEALGELAGVLEAAKLLKKRAKPLVEELWEACAAFDHGFNARPQNRQEHLKRAVHELLEFQHEVKEQLGRSHPALATLLIDGAQEIIDAVKPTRVHHHGEADEDEHDRD